ncbi:MAG: hypothetical protein MUE54_13775 [Anaerolineae bacterium]|jgi:WD40 repeat protein|nr:hypothetical protein [Anaerolineae bacterium]
MFKRIQMVMIGLGFILVACSPTQDEALPTRVVLPDDSSSVSVSASETEISAPTETPQQSLLPTLPSTFTPTPTETLVPTRTPSPTPVIELESILFVYNDDSVIRINADGTGQELIITFGVGARISDFSLSPKGDIVAFVAPGNGSAREIWIANTTGTYLQQVSCLGYSNIQQVTWSADGQVLAFLASPTDAEPMDIYTVGWQGANDCPIGNKQQQVLDRNSTAIGGLAFSADGGTLFFSDPQIYALNLTDFSLLGELSASIGFGADFSLAYSPTANILAYLQNNGKFINNTPLGNFIGLNVATLDVVSVAFQDTIDVQKFVWSRKGDAVLQSLENRVVIAPTNGGIATTVTNEAGINPNAVFNPDESWVAYLGIDENSPNIPQLFITSATGGLPRQITFITEGEIGNFVWVRE